MIDSADLPIAKMKAPGLMIRGLFLLDICNN